MKIESLFLDSGFQSILPFHKSYCIAIETWRSEMSGEPKQAAHKGQFVRAVHRHGATLRLTIDGNPLEAVEGDSLLAVLLLNRRFVRHFEFGDEPRAGFCLMGACQDCWVSLSDGERVRACTTLAADGMVIWTNPQKADADA